MSSRPALQRQYFSRTMLQSSKEYEYRCLNFEKVADRPFLRCRAHLDNRGCTNNRIGYT